jgi:membrane protease YdiL (CAAX protease family)
VQLRPALELLDGSIHVAGGGVILAAAVWWLWIGRCRNPLRDVHSTASRVTGSHVIGAIVFYVSLLWVVSSALQPMLRQAPPDDGSPRPLPEPGSHDWHVGILGDSIVKLVISGVMIWLLHALRTPRADSPRPRAGPDGLSSAPPATAPEGRGSASILRGAALAAAAAFAIIAMTSLQLRAEQIVWHWLAPGGSPPVHAVLQALHHGAWGPWGVGLLAAVALFIAPLTEELFFRGLLLDAVCSHLRRPWSAVAVSATAFGLMHIAQPQDVLPLTTMGVVLGALRLSSGSLTLCIIVHALFNLRTIGLLLLDPTLLTNP